MVEPLPKWIMQRYLHSIVLSELRHAGWLEMKLSLKDARKRIYKLKSPEQVVKEIGKEKNLKI